jgi:hypothetical protein
MWAQLCNILLGVWLMVSPDLLHFDGAPRTMARAIGPIVIAIGVLALRDVTRPARLLNFLPSLWLLLSPWFLHDAAGVPLASQELTGMAIAVCAAIRGPVRQQTGGGWLALLLPGAGGTPSA